MTRIVHLITDLARGGSEIILWKLLVRMDRSRFTNVVVSMTSRGDLAAKIERLGVPVFALGLRPKLPNPLGVVRLLGLLRAHRPHILQTWLFHADFLGILTGKLLSVPAVVWNIRCADLERADHPLHLWLTLKVLAKLSPLPNTVITNSTAGRLATERLGYRPKRWELIPNGFDLDIFRPSRKARLKIRQELGLENETSLVGLVARFDAMKDHETFLGAAERLHGLRPDVHFVLAGKGVDKRNSNLLKQIVAMDLKDHVHLLGEREDIQVVTAALDVATCSSYSEGFPNVVGEAMACGVPCVATDVGDCSMIISESGILVRPHDPYALSEGWLTLLNKTREDRQKLGIGARERIASLFNISNMVRQYEALYEEIVA